MPFPICWGWRTDQQEVEERWCERISCDIEGVYAVGLCVLRLLLVKVNSTWTWKIGIKSHRRMLQRHMAPNQNSGKKRSIAKIQKSVPLERSFLRAGIKGKITWGDVAPRKMRPQFSVVYGENIQKLKNSDKISYSIFDDVKGMPALYHFKETRRARIWCRFNTDALTSGSAVKSHDWSQKWEKYFLQDRQFRTSCGSRLICQFWKQFVFCNATTGIVGTRCTHFASRNRAASSSSSDSVLEWSDELAPRRLVQESLNDDKNDAKDPLADLPFLVRGFHR